MATCSSRLSRKGHVRLDFFNLLRVPVRVGGREQCPLASIQKAKDRVGDGVKTG
jgi:hypothetical protein